MKTTVLFVENSAKYVGRINVQIADKVKQLNEHGEEVETDVFSMDNFALTRSLRAASRDFLKWSLRKGSDLTAGEIGMLLFGAEIEIERTLRKEGDARQYGEGTYERDTYTTEIKSVKISDEALLDDLKESIKEGKVAQAVATANPFGF